MSEIQWTPDQLRAITETAPRILVSAAAGSGKTTVLTERIIRRLLDSSDPIDLSEMLIVTFTKAATADLREQIGNALTKALAANPTSRHLSRQLSLLPSAHISTIHAFCYGLIRLHFQQLSLPSSLRIADDQEGRLLAREVMEHLLDDLYEGGEYTNAVPDFALLIDQFVTIDDKDLGELFLSLYEKLQALPNGISGLYRCADHYRSCESGSFARSVWGLTISEEIADAMRYFRAVLKEAFDVFAYDAQAVKKYGEAFQCDLNIADRILFHYGNQDYDMLAEEVLAFRPASIKSTRYPDPPLAISDAAAVHGQMKEFMENLRKKCCFPTSEQTSSSASLCAAIVTALAQLLEEFNRRFDREKLRRGILDFGDLERYALRLLLSPSGEPTSAAHAVSARFREIYIDEYQDVNEVQDLIFSALSVRSRRFMVGDIKQSIYAFRGSAPHLFAAYRKDERFQTIFLSENFRSDLSIIRFSNAIFDYLFPHGDPEMPYEASDSLVCGKNPDSRKDIPCILSVIPAPKHKSDKENSHSDPEPIYVANAIRDLIANGYQPGDIVILLRSPSTRAQAYEEALEHAGISCVNKDKQSLLENEEVLLLLSLLKVIDNPRRDIDLAAVLRSPLYGMSMNDLVKIRMGRDGCLFDCLKQYTNERNFEPGIYFLKKLAEYRHAAIASPVDKLIRYLMDDTAISSFRIENGERQQDERANLLMFYDYARTFESGSFQGLSAFLKYIGGVLESDNNGKFRSPETQGQTRDTVRICSIHASKGLQFPVCFVCGVGHIINNRDATGSLLLDRELGISMKLTDESGFVHYDTPFRLAASRMLHRRTVYEEMRILYVALTRAKERLIVTGTASDPEELKASCFRAARHCPDGCHYPLTEGQPTYLKWILTSLFASDFKDYRLEIPDLTDTEQANPEERSGQEHPLPDPDEIAKVRSVLDARYSFRYPYQTLSAIPAKVTISKLYPSMLDPQEDGLDISLSSITDFRAPRFTEGIGITAADRGTATHQFMQFCDFDSIDAGSVDAEIDRLIEKRFLPSAAATLIYRDMLRNFFSSTFFAEMKNAAVLRREVRFNTQFPASLFATDPDMVNEFGEEELLVQGVIDCYFLTKDGKCVLLDYKTDHIPSHLRGNSVEEEKYLAGRHLRQLRYYRMALEKMLCRKVDKVILWSLVLGRGIDLTQLCGDEPQ